jgi:hypothetical protein
MRRRVLISCVTLIGELGLSLAARSQSTEAGAHVHDQTREVSSPSSSALALVARARSATEIYADRAVAIAAGYRRVGRDFPSMGEHWLSPRLIVEGAFDVSRPQLLTYVKIDGRPVLTGVVYAVPLKQGESPPGAFGPDALWHEHNGSIDEEGLLPEHHSTPSAAVGTRVAFLHVWTRIPASEGIFSAENWAIPFLRLHLDVPGSFPNGAARALSLLTGGREFFEELIGAKENATVASGIDAGVSEASATVARAKSQGRGFNSAELEALDATWKRLVSGIRDRLGADAAKRINGGMLNSEP